MVKIAKNALKNLLNYLHDPPPIQAQLRVLYKGTGVLVEKMIRKKFLLCVKIRKRKKRQN